MRETLVQKVEERLSRVVQSSETETTQTEKDKKMKKNSKTAKTIKANVVKEAPAKYGKGAPAPVPAPKAHVPVKADAKKVAETVALAKAVKDAPVAKAAPANAAPAKAPKQPKEKPFTKSMVEVDSKEYQQKHDKLPGTGKREPNTVWKFLIGTKPFEMKTEFFRTARLAAVEQAVAMKCTKVTVVA